MLSKEKVEVPENIRTLILVPREVGFKDIPETTEWLPLGPLFLAANVETEEVWVVDETLLKLDFNQLSGNIDHIAFYTTVTNYPRVLEIIEILQEVAPSIIIGLGGPYAISMWQTILSHQAAVDYLCLGYGEETFAKILAGENLDDIDNLAWLDGDPQKRTELVKDPELALKHIRTTAITNRNTNELNWPDYSQLPDFQKRARLYADKHPEFEGWKVISMSAADGCPAGPEGRCAFCTRFEQHYSVTKVDTYAQHLAAYIEEYGQVVITETTDDFVNIGFLRALDKKLDELGVDRNRFVIDFCFGSVARVISNHKDIDKRTRHQQEIISLLKKLNVQRILIGYEHRNRELLKSLKRGLTPEQQDEATALLLDSGIAIEAAFILGVFGKDCCETEDSLNELVEYATELVNKGDGLVNLSLSVLTLLPPSLLWQEAMKNEEFSRLFANKDVLDVEELQTTALRLFTDVNMEQIQQAMMKLASIDPQVSIDFNQSEVD